MTTLTKRHKGIRPLYDIALINWKKRIYIEEYPDGNYRIWNTKMLNSGCGKTISGDEISLMGCIYCPTCDEYFNDDQWETVDETSVENIGRVY